ncbi:MAG: hypothetical protein ABIK92_06860 [Pseudomonadota bacterium]
MEINAKLTLPMIKVGVGRSAQNYSLAARNFYLGIEALLMGSTLSQACTYITAQTLECVLKAYLSNTGLSRKDLKNNYIFQNLDITNQERELLPTP